MDDESLDLQVVRQWLMLTAGTIKVVEIYTNIPNGQRSWWTVDKREECDLEGPGPVRWKTRKVVERVGREEALALKQKYTYVRHVSSYFMVSID